MKSSDETAVFQYDESRIARLRGHDAVTVGKRLILKHPDFTGGYELAARGYEDLGRRKSATRILERGVARRPHWRLLESLAIRYSESGRFDDALEMLDAALGQVSDEASLHYNTALVLERLDRNEEALDSARRALHLDPDLSRACLLVASLECKVHRLEEGATRLEGLIERLIGTDDSRLEHPVLSDAYRALAEIELARKNRDRAVELFWKAVRYEKQNPAACYWIRELTGERSPDSCYWRVVVRGVWSADLPLPQSSLIGESDPRASVNGRAPAGQGREFITLFDVVAETREEALELLRPFEPPEVRPTLRLDSAKIMKRSVDDPKGVYRTRPYRWRDPSPAWPADRHER